MAAILKQTVGVRVVGTEARGQCGDSGTQVRENASPTRG